MTDAFLEFMLGPFRSIAGFYFEHQMILNTIIVGFAFYKLVLNKKKQTKKESAN